MANIAKSLLLVLVCCSLAAAQRGHRDPTPQDRDASPDRIIRIPQVDVRQTRKDAEELNVLATTIPADVDSALQGKLDKDLKREAEENREVGETSAERPSVAIGLSEPELGERGPRGSPAKWDNLAFHLLCEFSAPRLVRFPAKRDNLLFFPRGVCVRSQIQTARLSGSWQGRRTAQAIV